MKKVFLLFAFFGLFAFVANAQVCPHASKAKTAAKGQCHFAKNASTKAAALDSDIQVKVSSETGLVTYVKREVCCKTGKVSFTNVEYSAETSQFVNVSPKGQKTCTKASGAKAIRVANQSKSHCTPAQQAACSAHPACMGGGAKATKVANQSKSHCSPAQQAACAAHGAKASNKSAATNVKFVSNDDK